MSAATTPAAKKAAQKPPSAIALPAAHAGQPYEAFVPLPPPKFYGPPVFQLNPAPAWLVYESSTSTFRGVPDETETGFYEKITLKISPQSGIPGSSQTYIFTLPVYVGAQTVIVPNGPKIAPLAVKATPARTDKGAVVVQDINVDPSQIQFPTVHLSANLTTASTVLIGRVDPDTLPSPAVSTPGAATASSPTNYPLFAVAVTDPVSNIRSLLSFSQSGAKAGATTNALPINADGSFSLPLTVGLKVGEQVQLIAIAPPNFTFKPGSKEKPFAEGVALERIVVQATIPLPSVSLAGSLSAGESAVAGTVASQTLPASPTAAVAPDSKAGTPGSPGNLPLLAIEITDPLTKLASRAPLLVSGAPGATNTQIQVGADGSFNLPLKTALISGQKARIIAIPPQGYAFASSPDATCNFGGKRALWEAPQLLAVNECVVLPVHDAGNLEVYTMLTLTAPVVTSKLGLNTTAISGLATPSTTGASGTTVLIGVERYKLGGGCENMKPSEILLSNDLIPKDQCKEEWGAELADLATAASGTTPATTSKTVQTQANGSFSLTLAEPLAEEEKFRVAQILPPGTVFPGKKLAVDAAYSEPIIVPAVADWGRVHADFAAGLLTTNTNQLSSTDGGTFTQAHQFLDLTVTKGWALPGCYLMADGGACLEPVEEPCRKTSKEPCSDPCGDPSPAAGEKPCKEPPSKAFKDRNYNLVPSTTHGLWRRHHPGISSYFEGRLTAIAVTTVGSSTSSGSGGTSGTSASASTLLTSNFLTTAQTARFGTGVYAPTLLQRWDWHGSPNALFIAPLAKVGFDSVTGASTINVVAGTPGASASGTVTLEPLFNFWGYGARIGHFLLSRSLSKSPETESYLDVTYGPYSSLQSYICKATPADEVKVTTTAQGTTTSSTIYVPANGYPLLTGFGGSTCVNNYPSFYAAKVPSGLTFTIPSNTPTTTYTDLLTYSYQPYDSRKRIYRLDFEGLLRVPMTPLYLGFNANLGQKTLSSTKFDHGYAAPDDLEIFFGTKFDVGELLAKIGITPF